MMEIGKIQKLKVIKEKDFGIYLSDGDKADAQGVLLPKKQVPEGTKIGVSWRYSSTRTLRTACRHHIKTEGDSR